MILEPMLGEKRPADDEMVDLLPASYQENTRYRDSREDGMRPWVRSVVFVVLAVLIASLGWWARWSSPAPRATPDTYWYARSALQHAGNTDPVANREAAKLTCDGMLNVARPVDKSSPADCLSYRERQPGIWSPRYVRIFTARPGYPVLAEPLIRLLGPSGFIVATALLSIACGVAMAGLAVSAGLGRGPALAAAALFYALPSGLWATRMLSEAPMLLFLCLGLTGAMLLLRARSLGTAGVIGGESPRRTFFGCGLVALGLLGLFAVKSANGITVAAAMFAAGAAAVGIPLLRSYDRRTRYHVERGAVLLAVLAVAALGVHAASAEMFNLPGLRESVQETFSRHFTRPDVPDPWAQLRDKALLMWSAQVWPKLTLNTLLLLALGTAGLLLRFRRSIAFLLLLVMATGPAVATIHPVIAEFDRLTIVVWVPVALGLAALIARPSSLLDRPMPHPGLARSR